MPPFSFQIRVPRRVEASLSVDGLTFPATPDAFLDIQTFSPSEPLVIDLRRRNGRLVQVKLFFDDEWIVLSEMRFISGESTNPTEMHSWDVFSPQHTVV